VKYFFDNCLSYKYVDMLSAIGVDVVALRSAFPESTPDVELFQKIRGSASVFISCDRRQTTRDLEAQALRASGLTAIYLGPFWVKMKFWPQASWLVRHWPTIDAFASSVVPGTFAEVKHNGKVMVINV
jgi:hypothetical protein